MRPNKYDRLATDAAKIGVAAAINAVPAERRAALYQAMKSNRLSEYDIQNAIGRDTMNGAAIQSLSYSIRRQSVDLKNFRQTLWRKYTHIPFMDLKKDESAYLLKVHLHLKPRSNLQTNVVSGKVTEFTGMNGTTAYFTVSPGYLRFLKKIGSPAVGNYVFLRGSLMGRPFDGGEIWFVEAFDLKQLYSSPVYVGVCNGIYRTATSVQRCVSAINRIASKAVFGAMEGDKEGEE